MEQQKQAIVELVASHRDQGRRVGEVLSSAGVARSSYYRWKNGASPSFPTGRVIDLKSE
jgi:hypothetical protein